MKSRRLINSHGFSFIELIITLTFFAIILNPLYTFLSTLGNDSVQSHYRAKALILASNQLEKLSCLSFNELSISERTSPNYPFTIKTTIRYLQTNRMETDTLPQPFKLITTQVFWPINLSTSSNIVLSKVIAE